MKIEKLLEEINSDVIDVTRTDFEYGNTYGVPNRSNNQLTFERGITKRGLLLCSCVLYVDIRNSVALTHKHTTETMGRIYTSFSKAVLKIAKHHHGHIRNIIGDRIMIVFPAGNCFVNAVECAITINHVCKKVINKQFSNVDFSCGIGIDYGELRVIKVGIPRNGVEGAENKSLVWVGYPANIASRLTDVAAKKITENYFEVTRNKINHKAIKPILGLGSIYSGSSAYNPLEPLYLDQIEKVVLTPEQFANSISSVTQGELFMLGGKFIKFEKKEKNIQYPDILVTESVLDGYFKQKNNLTDSEKDFWKEQAESVKSVSQKIFGASITWKLT